MPFTKLHSRIRTVLIIATVWALVAALQAVYEYIILVNYGVLPEYFSLPILLSTNMATVFLSGLVAGFFFFPRINLWLRRFSYGKSILLFLAGFTVLFWSTSLLGSLLFNAQHEGAPFYDAAVLRQVRVYLSGPENLKNLFFWLFVSLSTVVALQVNDKYGPGNFINFLLGRYYHPRTEERIFMFLDLRASTAIAEQLGTEKYFEFTKDFFKHATDAILMTEGEVYQYIGDEILISWRLPKGIRNNNCLRCFFEVSRIIKQQEGYYLDRYGIIPGFKAGLHGGKVTAGEIGVIKRDIAFSGDVLNTAARIQAKCNELEVDILLSLSLADHLSLESSPYEILPMGQVDLRGKLREISLVSVRERLPVSG